MAEVAFRPVRQLSEYKGKGASASREPVAISKCKLQSFEFRIYSSLSVKRKMNNVSLLEQCQLNKQFRTDGVCLCVQSWSPFLDQ